MIVHRVAVIGAGLLGRRLAALCCRQGYAVLLEDVLPSRLRGAARQFEDLDFADSDKQDVAASEIRNPAVALVEYAGTIEEAVREADLVIDCVPDELESKLEILSLIDRMAPPRAIIATPTHTLSIADLASCTYRPDRCLAIELPAAILDVDAHCVPGVMRIVQTGETDPAVLEALVGFWRNVGFDPAVALDPGFAVSPATVVNASTKTR